LPHIVQVETEAHKRQTRDVLREYIAWLLAELIRTYNLGFDADAMLEQAFQEGGTFSPPDGRLLLALNGDEAAGLICLQRGGADFGEIKRMYVSPAFRGKGIGGLLVARVCEEARAAGYVRLRLDSAPFMQAAHSVYRAAGFREIALSPEIELPPGFDPNWVYMELIL
jgi:GNAT superfamily N-acetyltransferase